MLGGCVWINVCMEEVRSTVLWQFGIYWNYRLLESSRENLHYNSLSTNRLAESFKKWTCLCQLVCKELLIVFLKEGDNCLSFDRVCQSFCYGFHFIWSDSVILILHSCKPCVRDMQNKTKNGLGYCKINSVVA